MDTAGTKGSWRPDLALPSQSNCNGRNLDLVARASLFRPPPRRVVQARMSATATSFSTDGVPVGNRFRLSQEHNRELFGPSRMRQLSDGAFMTRFVSHPMGKSALTGIETSPAENNVLARHRKARTYGESLSVNIVQAGELFNNQLEISSRLGPGSFCVSDNHYDRACRYPFQTRLLAVTVPREVFEGLLGPSRLYAGLAIEADLPTASLMRSFVGELVRVHGRLTPEMAARMSGFGVDLIVASIAERMARDTPGPIEDTVLVQRAKNYVEANFGDPALDPPLLAAAMAVSLRRLQQLFQDRGRHVADWIWERRLVNAARRLADPGSLHVPIGLVAYGCGFKSQAHFSRRFRDRFGVSPRDYRQTRCEPGRVESIGS